MLCINAHIDHIEKWYIVIWTIWQSGHLPVRHLSPHPSDGHNQLSVWSVHTFSVYLSACHKQVKHSVFFTPCHSLPRLLVGAIGYVYITIWLAYFGNASAAPFVCYCLCLYLLLQSKNTKQRTDVYKCIGVWLDVRQIRLPPATYFVLIFADMCNIHAHKPKPSFGTRNNEKEKNFAVRLVVWRIGRL